METDARTDLAVKYLLAAVKKFYESDYILFQDFQRGVEGMERACAFRIGSYFREMVEEDCANFYGYHVDMEYNRQTFNGNTSSKEFKTRSGNRKTTRRVPDLILHKRGEQDNILICEFKVNKTKKNSKDVNELIAATKDEHTDQYVDGYKIGIYIELGCSFKNTRVTFFIPGNINKNQQPRPKAPLRTGERVLCIKPLNTNQ